MVIEVLRRSLDDLPPGQAGWLAGLRDDPVGRKWQVRHGRPLHLLALGEPAPTTAFRSKPQRRFTLFRGQPPVRRRAQSHVPLAANPLVQCSRRVAPPGEEVGFDSEAAFNRAFNKATGPAPGIRRETRRTART